MANAPWIDFAKFGQHLRRPVEHHPRFEFSRAYHGPVETQIIYLSLYIN
jgi:hypothetical protein